MKTFTVRDVVIGEGIPKICVPLVGRTREEILQEARLIAGAPTDLTEFRADYFEGVLDYSRLEGVLYEIREIVGNLPVLMTLRSLEEGGCRTINDIEYSEINKKISSSGIVDLIDVELSRGDKLIRDIIDTSHAAGVGVIVSSHDFKGTPAAAAIVNRLRRMQETGADIVKIAVMPQARRDVITLLAAADEMLTEYADRPVIAISMSEPGMITRIAGEAFGSAVTFGCVSRASAPGQIGVYELKDITRVLHGLLKTGGN